MEESPASLKISKTDAAKRQLETAIRMWFFDGDPVSIHALGAAAHQLVHDLGKARGITAVLRSLPDIRQEYKKEMLRAVAQDENFFKHADRDPDGLLDFKPITTTFFLMDAVLTYEALTGERPPILRAFQMWMMLQNPGLVKEESRADWTAQMKGLGSTLARMSKQEFFTLYLGAIAKSQSA
jgi:hypothetical protein